MASTRPAPLDASAAVAYATPVQVSSPWLPARALSTNASATPATVRDAAIQGAIRRARIRPSSVRSHPVTTVLALASKRVLARVRIKWSRRCAPAGPAVGSSGPVNTRRELREQHPQPPRRRPRGRPAATRPRPPSRALVGAGIDDRLGAARRGTLGRPAARNRRNRARHPGASPARRHRNGDRRGCGRSAGRRPDGRLRPRLGPVLERTTHNSRSSHLTPSPSGHRRDGGGRGRRLSPGSAGHVPGRERADRFQRFVDPNDEENVQIFSVARPGAKRTSRRTSPRPASRWTATTWPRWTRWNRRATDSWPPRTAFTFTARPVQARGSGTAAGARRDRLPRPRPSPLA